MTSLIQRRDADPTRRLVGASILAADFANLAADAQTALDAGADFLHVDIMDGHFVPNLSMGPEISRGLRRVMPDVIQDVHLMVQYPEQYFERFRDAGADHITLHAEVIEPRRAAEISADLREMGVTSGISVKPRTRLGDWMQHLAAYDMVLVMSIEPGFAGQAFMPSALERIELLRRELGPDMMISVDGGVSEKNAPSIIDAGADVLVAATAIFGRPVVERAPVIRGMRGGEIRT